MDTAPRVKLRARLSPTSWLTTKTVFSQIFAILLFAIQAPLLGPKAFGLISLVMVFIGFCEFVPCEAASDSLISVREAEEEHFATTTTAIVAFSLLFGVLIFIGADWLGKVLAAPELGPILRVMAILPALTAVSAAPTAFTKREMQFGPLALRSIISMLVGGVVGLVLTLTGFGVWALVWQALVTRLVIAVVLWKTVPLKFRFGFSRRHFNDVLRYAAPTLVSRVMNWGGGQIPRFLLGLFWGPTPLGLFSLASKLTEVLLEVTVVPRYAVARVELRRFAGDPVGLAAALRKAVTLMSVFCFPLCVGGAVVVPTLFHVWLDPRWYAGIIATQILLLACMAQITHYCAGATLLACNFQKAEAIGSVVQTLTTVVAVLIAAPFGITVAAAVIGGRPVATIPVPVTLLKRKCGLSPRVILGAQVPALAAALVMGVGVWLLQLETAPWLSGITELLLLVVAGAALYALMIALLMPGFAAQFIRRSQPAV
ncbi:MAG TPA: oligosaccharide flippase family protein [Steroidobacteraceae bacterium]|nr:oligosaccharide flippase family protein [Steroidobacteraceae bacterium]